MRTHIRVTDRVLMLGVTPEYAEFGHRLTAVDSSAAMIQHVWPGDTPHRRAVLCDWKEHPMQDTDIVIGDGSLNATPHPESVVTAVHTALRHGARMAVFRIFVRPDTVDMLEDLHISTAGEDRFKFLMRTAAHNLGKVHVSGAIHLHPPFPAADSPPPAAPGVVLSFPTLDEWREILPTNATFAHCHWNSCVSWVQWSR
jgi:hypothetical protein